VTYEIIPATIVHVHQLARVLREADAAEARALGQDPRKLLRASFRMSLYARTAFVEGKIAAMWGLTSDILSDTGCPWLLTSAAIESLPMIFAREARKEVAAMLSLRPRLENFVAADYGRACRFLEILGFTVDPPAPLGPRGALFRRAHIEGCD
jgi:hypothetical protein